MKILYATDGSEGALAGAALLGALALDSTSQIQILAVQDRGEEEAEEQTALAAARDALQGCAAGITTTLRRGHTVSEILDEANDLAADLVVVGTRGRSAVERFLTGSVAERVTQYAPCPVLLARPLQGTLLDRILLGMDGSDCALRAATWLQTLPLPSVCELRLVTVVTPHEAVFASRMAQIPAMTEQIALLTEQEKDTAHRQLKETAATLEGSGKRVTTEVREDEPASGLIEAAQTWHADLLVVGSQGLTGIDRFLLGSVSEKAMRHAPCSVLVVK